MDAKLGHRPSHAWRSIYQGIQLAKQGLKWRIGDGNTVIIWQDLWIDNPPHPARRANPSQLNPNSLKVVDLLTPSTNQWNEEKLRELVHSEDISLIRRIRPRLAKVPDIPIWTFTNNGHYSVKSGYHQLTKVEDETVPSANKLWKSLWSLQVPPKIKHFWWRALHNALPVAETLVLRNINIPRECHFCGEAQETIIHLLFHCRTSREVWELSHVPITAGQLDSHNFLARIIQILLSAKNVDSPKEYIFPFIGWRIWKACNALLYNSKRWSIPDIIRKALMDFRLWKEAQNGLLSYDNKHGHQEKINIATNNAILNQTNSFYCYTDGSWLNNQSRAGIGWTLPNTQGKCILKGSSSIEPTNSALEAEAIAIKEALLQIRHLDYYPVVFCGDSKTIYTYL
ncbi:PREDICTED: uncharacterized protein LOC104783756 [Camelina sativa]|uniref:Uncharacterized protein LOC104783756 n=1 Tax=Camelina sativa TaxID=90675 RepID=A0ABM0YX15_CAMSA|nr:PREDICTED: uncharacterized protein LOC104783756 [Camelina sativa]